MDQGVTGAAKSPQAAGRFAPAGSPSEVRSRTAIRRVVAFMRLPLDDLAKKLLTRGYAPFGWARSPNHVSMDITRRCNLRCQMCFYYGGEGRHEIGFQELSAEEIVSLVVNRLKGVDYDLTGGEPLVRHDLAEVLIAIRKRKGSCSLTTNGTLMTRELAKRIVGDELLRGVHFSLHGLRETHEGITRVKNSFAQTLKGIETLLSERGKGGKKVPEVIMACTISGKNSREAEGLINLMSELGADQISFGHASFMPEEIREVHEKTMERLGLSPEQCYDDLVAGPPEIPMPGEDLEIYIQTLSRFRRSAGEGKIETSPEEYGEEEIRRHFLDMNWTYKTSCTYPWRNLRIGPDGTVTPCVGYRIGNVKDQDVRKLWNHPRFRRFRAALYRQKLFPGCLRCCKLK
jgi:MoaA/NifB/PqqE/SkfB family radical SAM enzyme